MTNRFSLSSIEADAAEKETPSVHHLLVRWVVAIFLLASATVNAEAPTKETDKAISGSWNLSGPHSPRVYEITEQRNLKIIGGQIEEKRGRLLPHNDGSYECDADGTFLRLVYVAPNDQVVVEWYASKSDLTKRLAPLWKGTAVRRTR